MAFGAEERGTAAIPAHVRRYRRPEDRPASAARVLCLAWDHPSKDPLEAAWELYRGEEGWMASDGQ
jgi:hypothetical protein